MASPCPSLLLLLLTLLPFLSQGWPSWQGGSRKGISWLLWGQLGTEVLCVAVPEAASFLGSILVGFFKELPITDLGDGPF